MLRFGNIKIDHVTGQNGGCHERKLNKDRKSVTDVKNMKEINGK